MNRYSFIWLFFLIALIFFCTSAPQQRFLYQIPPGFPEISIPESNLPDEQRLNLGRKLFFDPILSADSSISCASCHNPRLAFADTVSVSVGTTVALGNRNTPTLVNIGFAPYYLYEGGVKTLEEMVVVPLHSSSEMGLNMRESIRRINQNQTYKEQFLKAYGEQASTYTLTRALAAYQRTLISANSKYDRYINGDKNALNMQEKHGMKLFFSKELACAECHVPPLFTDFGFYNIGIDSLSADKGRYRVTELAEDLGKFKTPTLRNVALTYPYFHHGKIRSLDAVIDVYNRGGNHASNKDPRIKKLGLTAEDKKDLIEFLKALTDFY